jgi:hypothetical protein
MSINVTAQLETAALQGLTKIIEKDAELVKNVEKAYQASPDGLTTMDKMPSDQIERARKEQSVSEEMATFGLDRHTTETYIKSIKDQSGASNTQAMELLQMVALKAGEMSMTPQELFPVVLAIFIRQKDVKLTVAVLDVLSKYESMMPGIGVIDLARRAATGLPIGSDMLHTRLLLQTVMNDYSSAGLTKTKDLEKAIYSIIAPQSGAGAEMMRLLDERLQTNQKLEEWYIILGRVMALFEAERHQVVQNVMSSLIENSPGFASHPLFVKYRQVLDGIAAAAILKANVANRVFTPVNQGPSPLQQAGRSASSNFARVVTSQTATTDLRSTSPAAGTAPAGTKTNAPAPAAIPNAPEANAAAAQANQANKAQVAPNLADALSSSSHNTDVTQRMKELEQQLTILVGDANGVGPNGAKPIIPAEIENLTKIISQSGASEILKTTDGSSLYLTPAQIAQQAVLIEQKALRAKSIINDLLELNQKSFDNLNNTNELQDAAKALRDMNYRRKLLQVEGYLVTAFDIRLIGPIEQQINMLTPQKEYLKSGMDMAKGLNNIGADQYVGPFSALCMQISQLRSEAARLYMEVASNPITPPHMKNFCLDRARKQMIASIQARNEGAAAVMNMTSGIFNTKSLMPTASSETWTRLGLNQEAEIEREADAELEEYWNELYKDSPGAEGYGTALEHALKYHNVPTDQVPASKPRMRRNTSESGSSS